MTIVLCSMLVLTLGAGSVLAQPTATVEGVVTDTSGRGSPRDANRSSQRRAERRDRP